MNATMFAELRQATAGAASDQKMDQVRDLLFGEFRRSCEARLDAFEARLAQVEAKLSALAATTDQDRRGLIEDLAKAVGELSGRIGAISSS